MNDREAKFEIYQDAGNSWRWRLVAGNGEKIAASEAYTTKADAQRAANTTATVAPMAAGLNVDDDDE